MSNVLAAEIESEEQDDVMVGGPADARGPSWRRPADTAERAPTLRRRIYELVITPEIDTSTEMVLRIIIAGLITLNVLVVILETVESIDRVMSETFLIVEVVSVFVFSVEYLLRLWAVVEEQRYSRPLLGRIRYAFSFFAVVDLLAIIPFFLPHLFPIDLLFLRGVRLLRLVRVLKLGRYSKSFEMLSRVVHTKRHDIGASVFVLLLMLILSSSLMYFLEHHTQPQAFPSIPASMWWGVSTLTGIGGD